MTFDSRQDSATDKRAVVLVHDRDPALGLRNIGTLAPELESRGYRLDVHSFDYGHADTPPSLDDAGMVVVMGSPDAAYGESSWIGPEIDYLERAIEKDVPILGVCFGGQLLARILGGTVTRSQFPEHGLTETRSTRPDLIGPGPWMEYHDDTFVAPDAATVIASNSAGQQAFVHGRHLGLQFHPEIDVDVFDSWADAWVRDGIEQDQDMVDAIRKDLVDNEADLRARCAALLDGWISCRPLPAAHYGGEHELQ
ncbi:type 1 glutamine amidotransferase [Rhodococcus sp. 114MFTsu3.1]|uniref:type 1 glutamine amidotransferase n=1 Tax=Rhodococcus sp. 114MFTsu3.1 TaxID=1172184 RepID=UPI00036AF889|nr:type 1 glutamine amidotransferase [Rhodococcus sp. 114MFTsu3.1]